ncbi:hypothetical protein SHIRM173S_00245 [Streptomyces hirsutus]
MAYRETAGSLSSSTSRRTADRRPSAPMTTSAECVDPSAQVTVAPRASCSTPTTSLPVNAVTRPVARLPWSSVSSRSARCITVYGAPNRSASACPNRAW